MHACRHRAALLPRDLSRVHTTKHIKDEVIKATESTLCGFNLINIAHSICVLEICRHQIKNQILQLSQISEKHASAHMMSVYSDRAKVSLKHLFLCYDWQHHLKLWIQSNNSSINNRIILLSHCLTTMHMLTAGTLPVLVDSVVTKQMTAGRKLEIIMEGKQSKNVHMMRWVLFGDRPNSSYSEKSPSFPTVEVKCCEMLVLLRDEHINNSYKLRTSRSRSWEIKGLIQLLSRFN